MMPTRDTSNEHVRGVLFHPLTLAALGLLALNDHLLRRLWPSPLTGKLGDLAWLTFAPLVAAALLELVWLHCCRPDWNSARSLRGIIKPVRYLGLVGFGLVGGIFALAKTVPGCHAAVVAVASALFGFPAGWRRDPTDLVALVALIPAWWCWQRAGRRASGGLPLPRLHTGFVIVLAALLTVANSPAPRANRGIEALWADGRQAYAADSAGGTYRSADGGLSWAELTRAEKQASWTATAVSASATREAIAAAERARQATVDAGETRQARTQARTHSQETREARLSEDLDSEAGQAEAVATPPPAASPPPAATATAVPPSDDWIARCYKSEGDHNWICDPLDAGVRYRWVAGRQIERSNDAGQHWRRELTLSLMSDAERTYHLAHSLKPPGPNDTVDVETAWPSTIHVYKSTLDGRLEVQSPPALIDPRTGDLILAMGHQGVLVRKSDGEWWWIPVGPYHLMPPPGATPGPLRAPTPGATEMPTAPAAATPPVTGTPEASPPGAVQTGSCLCETGFPALIAGPWPSVAMVIVAGTLKISQVEVHK